MPQTESKKKTRPPQRQKRQPGREYEMRPRPEVVQREYRAAGKLEGKVALITGGDSGIPGLTTDLAAIVTRFLPARGGIGQRHARGFQSDSNLRPEFARQANFAAALANNEIRQNEEK